MITLVIIIIAESFLIVYLMGIATGKKVAYAGALWFRLLIVLAVISLVFEMLGGMEGLTA